MWVGQIRNKTNNDSTRIGIMKKAMKSSRQSMARLSAFLFAMALGASAFGDVYWNGGTSSDWSNPANWFNGLPSVPGAGNAVINPWGVAAPPAPTVSTLGNTTVGQVYLATGGGLNVVSGGQLSIASDLVTGMWGSSLTLNVSGGELNIGGYLNMGPGGSGFDADISISGGKVTANNLTFNPASTAGMDISGTGSFVAPSAATLANINYWVNSSHTITANGGAAGWAINIDTATLPGSVILTASQVPEPSAFALFGLGAAVLGLIRRRS